MQVGRDNTQDAITNLGLSQASPEQLPNTQTLGRDEFLKLLVTQLSFQDPLEPLTNEEFIAQTAQFSTLEQLQELNNTILNQIPLQRTISNAMAVQYVGKMVEAPGSKVSLTDGEPARFGAKLAESAEVQVEIYNAAGRLVSSVELGTQNAQRLRVEWDGRDLDGQPLPDGIYTFNIRATDEAGEAVNVTPVMSGQVSGIVYENDQARLSVYGELISPSDIFSASLPQEESTND